MDAALKQEKEQIARLVQDLLVKRLRKHEIEIDRAKTIARAVVEALQSSPTAEEVEEVMPTLSAEFIELQEVIDHQNDICRHDIEQKVTAFVKKFIEEGKFNEAHQIAEDALKAIANRDLSCRTIESMVDREYEELEHGPTPAQPAAPAEPQQIPTETTPVVSQTQPVPVLTKAEPAPSIAVQPAPTLAPANTSDPQLVPIQRPGTVVTVQPPTSSFAMPERTSGDHEPSMEVIDVPGSDQNLVPVYAPAIPKDAAPPPLPEAITDSSNREPHHWTEHAPAAPHDPAAIGDSAKQMGNSLLSEGKKLLDKAQNAVFKKLDAIKAQQETVKKAAEKAKDEF